MDAYDIFPWFSCHILREENHGVVPRPSSHPLAIKMASWEILCKWRFQWETYRTELFFAASHVWLLGGRHVTPPVGAHVRRGNSQLQDECSQDVIGFRLEIYIYIYIYVYTHHIFFCWIPSFSSDMFEQVTLVIRSGSHCPWLCHLWCLWRWLIWWISWGARCCNEMRTCGKSPRRRPCRGAGGAGGAVAGSAFESWRTWSWISEEQLKWFIHGLSMVDPWFISGLSSPHWIRLPGAAEQGWNRPARRHWGVHSLAEVPWETWDPGRHGRLFP